MKRQIYFFFFILFGEIWIQAQPVQLDTYNVDWKNSSRNSSESMTCGGDDIGLNIWVEHGDILFYVSKSGFFDENNCLLKVGRVRLKLSPNPFDGEQFSQALKLKDGFVQIDGSKNGLRVQVQIWVDVFRPVVQVERVANRKVSESAGFESQCYADYDKGLEYNAWLKYEWDTVLEFCMMLETEHYDGKDIFPYLPFIESCLTFFDEHYQYLAVQRGSKTLDANGHLVLCPGSGCETYKMATNSSSTIAGLKTVLIRLLELPSGHLSDAKIEKWKVMLKTIPPISIRVCKGFTTISRAKTWERINNVEVPQLYPVFPWRIYGFGKPDLELALNTWKYDPEAIKFRSHIGWKQDNIFAACLGLTEEAKRLNFLKLKDSERRFPAFWGPGFEWVPDHNWGGAGMIGIQEMLLQVDGDKIHLFPAGPKDCDVHFKLHAPKNTTIEAKLKNGIIEFLRVIPEQRGKDIVTIFQK